LVTRKVTRARLMSGTALVDMLVRVLECSRLGSWAAGVGR
jgi:hypothetical protein